LRKNLISLLLSGAVAVGIGALTAYFMFNNNNHPTSNLQLSTSSNSTENRKNALPTEIRYTHNDTSMNATGSSGSNKTTESYDNNNSALDLSLYVRRDDGFPLNSIHLTTLTTTTLSKYPTLFAAIGNASKASNPWPVFFASKINSTEGRQMIKDLNFGFAADIGGSYNSPAVFAGLRAQYNNTAYVIMVESIALVHVQRAEFVTQYEADTAQNVTADQLSKYPTISKAFELASKDGNATLPIDLSEAKAARNVLPLGMPPGISPDWPVTISGLFKYKGYDYSLTLMSREFG
jgi:hypothetical protein